MARVVTADGTRISYDTFGHRAGEPLLLVMGLGIDRWGWIRQRGALGSRYLCVSPDNRGVGLSDKPVGPYELETMADDMIAVLDAEGIDSAHLVGGSMGGAISQIIAVKYPERVRSLVLACTACRVTPWRRKLLQDWIDLLDQKGSYQFARENIRWVLGARHVKRLLPLAPFMLPLAVRAPARGIRAQMQAILGVSPLVQENLESIAAPTLAITGSQDILTPVADAEELVERIPDAELRIVPGAAHGFMVVNAATFNHQVLAFHDRIRARSQLGASSGAVDDAVIGNE
ncbi:MAG: alpha/beta hydrolase [Acidimicrobiia bacterium]|nr:alpha/beta hydrolase [Acidimicrobiia bacterium]